MASLIIGAGVLAYEQIKQAKEKKKAHNSARFSELEKVNAERVANLQKDPCFCQRSDWTGGECAQHGYVPPHPDASLPRYSSDGQQVTREGRERPLQTEGWEKAPPAMDSAEIARINEQRRKKGRGHKRLFSRGGS